MKDCGCCWAIIAVQNAESIVVIETGQFTQLSVQQIIDCCGNDGKGVPYGCSGGFLQVAFKHMMKNGLTSFQDYPLNLLHREGPCMAAGKPIAVQVLGYDKFPGLEDYKFLGKEPPTSFKDALEKALLKSPISINIYANKFFQTFKGNSIIEFNQCPPPPKGMGCNHCVLLVGFGCDRLGNKFWLIQNVWGERWGHNGYARLRRGVSDPQGVRGIHCDMSSRPVLKSE